MAQKKNSRTTTITTCNPPGLDTLMPEIYDHLRYVARKMLLKSARSSNKGLTMQATAVVHEAWAKLSKNGIKPNDRQHLIALSSRVIRQVVSDYVRSRERDKRGGGKERLQLDEVLITAGVRSEELIALDDAMNELAKFGPRQAQVVELRFFGSLTMSEISELLGVSKRTVEDDWAAAKAWLYDKIIN